MSQSLTPITKEIYSTITSKGQVTIPVEVRKHLGVATNDKIAFIIRPVGTVEVKTPKYPTLASLQGSAGKLKKPLTWQELEDITHEEMAENAANEGR